MVILISSALFMLGAIVASFVGVLVARLNTGQGFLVGRSRCDACNSPLSSFALIPVVAYLISSGRAHCCGARISPISPLTEILLGVLFVLSYLNLGLTFALSFFLISISALLALVLYDLAHQILPSSLLTVFVVASTVSGFLIAETSDEFFSYLVAAFFIAASLALIHFFSRGRAMGLADAPLSFGLATLAGTNALSGFIFSFWIGAVIGVVLLYRRPVGSRMMVEVPFAPFLVTGFLLAYFTQWNIFALIADLH
jgi:leader peptidase (prepilin peptidase) / N-methyltransferase